MAITLPAMADTLVVSPDADRAGAVAEHADVDANPVEVEEELLVEEISIDGMCGVY